jgi:hypothetical protein
MPPTIAAAQVRERFLSIFAASSTAAAPPPPPPEPQLPPSFMATAQSHAHAAAHAAHAHMAHAAAAAHAHAFHRPPPQAQWQWAPQRLGQPHGGAGPPSSSSAGPHPQPHAAGQQGHHASVGLQPVARSRSQDELASQLVDLHDDILSMVRAHRHTGTPVRVRSRHAEHAPPSALQLVFGAVFLAFQAWA